MQRGARHEAAVPFSNGRWTKTLLTRCDTTLWRPDVEFIAAVYNVPLRREQDQAVEAVFKSERLSDEELRNLQSVAASGLMAAAMAAGVATVSWSMRTSHWRTGSRRNIERECTQRSLQNSQTSAHTACASRTADSGELAPCMATKMAGALLGASRRLELTSKQ